YPQTAPQPREITPSVWAIPRSLATTRGISIDFFSSGYLDVSVHRVCLRLAIYSPEGYRGITLDGLPHSGIPGSTPACGSPRLIAANHALHRFLAPRHPPCALSSLTIKPLPTNGLQVEGQGSEQEPWFWSDSRTAYIPSRVTATKTLLDTFRACDRLVTI